MDQLSNKSTGSAHEAMLSKNYAKLFLKFVLFSILCSCIPLCLIGIFIHDSYFEYSSQKMVGSLLKRVDANRDLVDDYFKERLNDLTIITMLYSFDFLKDQSNLNKVFNTFKTVANNYEDLGVINQHGFHESYVGPYDLMANDYSETFWFKGLMVKGSYISDMFLGYREIPHIIIAIAKIENGKTWILRATINADLLNAKLRRLILGEEGQAFLMNSEGYYQASPRALDNIMKKSSRNIGIFRGTNGVQIVDSQTASDPNAKIVAYSWLNNPKWVLIFEQDYREFYSDREYVDRATWSFLGLSALSVLLIVALSTAYIVRAIKNRDQKLDKLNMQLLQAGKLASVGQLAAGVAHEINNPIAIIQSEIDLMRVKQRSALWETACIDRTLAQIEAQVERCSKITTKLLGFARTKSDGQSVDLNVSITEVAQLFEKWASAAGIMIGLELGEDLPKVKADSFEVGQVFVNLVGNAIDAHEGKNGGFIKIRTWHEKSGNEVIATVSDSGCGISAENRKSIFDPFFTTKAAGKGTGLGLFISYSLMKNLGGKIDVQSEFSKGTQFSLFFPIFQEPH